MDLYFDLQLFTPYDVTLKGGEFVGKNEKDTQKLRGVTLGGAAMSGDTVTLGQLSLASTGNTAIKTGGSWVYFKKGATDFGKGLVATSVSSADVGLTNKTGGFGFQILVSADSKNAVNPSRMFVNGGTFNLNQGNAIKLTSVYGAANFNLSEFTSGMSFAIRKDVKTTFNFNNSATDRIGFSNASSVAVTSGMVFSNAKGSFSLTSASFNQDLKVAANKNDVITLVGAGRTGKAETIDFKGDGSASVYFNALSGALAGSIDSMGGFTYVTDSNGGSLALSSVKSSAVSMKGNSGADTVTISNLGAGSSANLDMGDGNNRVSLGTVASEGKATIKGGTGADTISVDSIGSDGSLNIASGDGADSITISSLSSSAGVTITNAKGKDTVALSGVGVETLVMGSLGGSDGAQYTVSNWFESTGDTSKGNVVSLAGGIADFSVTEVTNGTGTFAWGAGMSAVQATSKDASGVVGAAKLGVNIKSADGTNSALLVGSDSLQSSSNIKFDNYDYIIGVAKTDTAENRVLNLGDTNKKVVHLAHTASMADGWEETATYKDITNVQASSVGKSLIINGTSLAGSLVAGGANDSLWGGGNVATDSESNHDTLVGSGKVASASTAHLYTGFDEGIDIVTDYKTASTKAKADIIHFLGGAGYQEATANVFKVGEDEKNHFEISVTSAAAGGDKFWYGYGLDAENSGLAIADLSSSGSTLTYDSLGSFYFGQGEQSTVSIDGSLKTAAKLNWDGGAGTFSVGAIDGTSAVEGAMLVGLANYSQTVKGSNVGASSISGGVVVGDWSDTGRDTLIGGSKETMFYVGKGMGNDEIQNLVKDDKIVFLNTKYEDLTTDLTKITTTDTDMTFRFSNGARITASTASSTALSKISSLTLYFDDKDAVWDGKTWTVTDKQ